MLFGIASEIALVLFLAYFKPFNIALVTRNIRLVHWLVMRNLFCSSDFPI
jgi:hypothetical protein